MTYPGTPQHQALLRTIVGHYEHDPRILAIVVFGSLGRGNWDALSDIDLDVVIADNASIDVVDELRKLCATFAPLGENAALIIPGGDDTGDVVLESLMQLSGENWRVTWRSHRWLVWSSSPARLYGDSLGHLSSVIR